MHAYLLILEITPLKIEDRHDMLPLHCTLVHWFWLDQSPEIVAAQLQVALGDTGTIKLTAGGEQTFTGKTKGGKTVPVTVNDIRLTPQLRTLHEHACSALEELDVRYSEPQYTHDGFNPHVTHQKDGQLMPGEVRGSSRLYLIEAAAPEYGNERTVRTAIDLI